MCGSGATLQYLIADAVVAPLTRQQGTCSTEATLTRQQGTCSTEARRNLKSSGGVLSRVVYSEAEEFSEKLLRLPHSYFVNDYKQAHPQALAEMTQGDRCGR